MRGLVTRRKLAFCALAVVGALLLSVGAGAKGQPVPVLFYLELTLPLDAQGNPAGWPTGTFTLSGALADSGDALETFRFSPAMDKGHPVAHGEKTLWGANGEIMMKFNVQIFNLNPADPTVDAMQSGIGTWIIESGTGAYEGIRGSGTAYVEIRLGAGVLLFRAYYTGTVQ